MFEIIASLIIIDHELPKGNNYRTIYISSAFSDTSIFKTNIIYMMKRSVIRTFLYIYQYIKKEKVKKN